MKSHYMALTVLGVAAICLPACFGHGDEKAAKVERATVVETTTTVTTPPDRPVRVVLLDSQTGKGLWYIDTTRSHIEFLEDTGTIRVDGQLWSGPYKVVSR